MPDAAIRQVLLKVNSRCNLSCDYCYIYESQDQGWRAQPTTMSDHTINRAAARIAEHAIRHQLPYLELVLHGGEPLLAGVSRLERILDTVLRAVPAGTRVATSVQTNGVLLDEDFLSLFKRYGTAVGVSLDGGMSANDRHRKYANGHSSYTGTAAGLTLLRQYPDLYSGILATIDLRNDPLRTYTELLNFKPPRLDFLLPHGNWTIPPPGRSTWSTDSPYGNWMIAVFDRWFGAPHRETQIRLLESVLSLLFGGSSHTEMVGLDPVDLLTIETDGSIEQVDILKSAGPGMAATGLHIESHSFDEALEHPGIRARMQGLASLGIECRECPLVRVCGGGHYAHRYKAGEGFEHRSVYCPDLQTLIGHIRSRVIEELRPWRRPTTA